MRQTINTGWNSFTSSLDKLPNGLRNFLYGGLGYLLGAVIGLLLLQILNWLNLAHWLIGLLPEGQYLLAVISIPLLAGLFLGMGGAITGLFGGWSLGYVLGLERKRSIMVDSAIAFAASQGLLVLVFLLLVSLVAVYNNFYMRSAERFGVVFGLFGLIFGIFSGIILALMSLRLRHTWRVFLAAPVGFLLAGIITGVILRIVSPAEGFSRTGGAVALVFSFLSFYFIGGGVLGWAYGRLANKTKRQDHKPESVLPPVWQEISTAVIGVLIVLGILSIVGQISQFLVIDPANLQPQLVSETTGVRYSEPGDVPIDTSSLAETIFEQPSLAVDQQNTQHILWRGGSSDQPEILYSQCKDGSCSQPEAISNPGNLPCLRDITGLPSQPAIAIDKNGHVIAAWQHGNSVLIYSRWEASSVPSQLPTGCVPGIQGKLQGSLGLASTGAGHFTLAYNTGDAGGTIYTTEFNGSEWSAAPTVSGSGNNPALASNAQGDLFLAYCASEEEIALRLPDGSLETVPEGDCSQPPALALGAEDQPHITWYADQLADVNGVQRPASAFMESIHKDGVWSTPVVAAKTLKSTEPAMTGNSAGTLLLLWADIGSEGQMLLSSAQPVYQCDPASLNPIEQAGLAAILDGNFRPAGQAVPYCENRFDALWYMPNPEPAFSDSPATENGAFDRAASFVDNASYELLFTTMQYEPLSTPPSPGETLAQALVALYDKVKSHPEFYPRGMNVRILLGNYPTLSTFEWGDQIWAVMEDLHDAGLEKLVDEDIGWRVEIANYAGTYPHAHTKFLVMDGANVVGAGFNYGYLHFPKDHPSGKGYDLFDLGLRITGPVAQDALAAFDNLWQGANQLACTTLAGENWKDSCQFKTAEVSHSPEVLQTYVPEEGQDTSFSLLRTYNHLEGDAFVSTAIKNATETIDMMQVNFSLEIYCMIDLIFPGICDFSDALPYMEAMMEAIERDHVKVRVIMENSNSNGLENRVAGRIFLDELERRGLEEYVELRFYDGKVHAKSTLVDSDILMIGSMNMHYSSWGTNGLAEYVVTTNSQPAIQEYKKMFDTKWANAVPFDQANYGITP